MRPWPPLRTRVLQPELMDDPALDAAEHRSALAGLRMVNRASRTAGALWKPIAALQAELRRPLRVLDIATGSGDVPLALQSRADHSGTPIEFHGCDFSPRAIEVARERACTLRERFFVHDVLARPLPTGFDAITCSLFMHHLERPAALQVLTAMSQAAGHLVLVSDLRRCRRGYLLAYLASRAFSRSRVVHTDALLSVRAAFTPQEFRALAAEAELRGATIHPCWPCRFLLRWRRP